MLPMMNAHPQELKRRLAFPDSGRVQTKGFLRKEVADAWLVRVEC